ncbi:MAG: dTDP-glucose 4,6-dehydratase [Desulfarculus sp.]|jgi:dTDP-glucose 4,6-dehydratase|nr:MAG: dTDP-glucose 4,6-dehydratase [Desulfarculus sp.]
MKTILVTGGAGFIGSAVVRMLIARGDCHVVNLDKLTYAANLDSLTEAAGDPNYHFQQGDICDAELVKSLLAVHRPQAIMHLAAESHVDRSIDGPGAFVQTNIVGTYTLLEAAQDYWQGLPSQQRDAFRFLHVSTDEVFGSLPAQSRFNEDTAYRPNSPYAASKASADFLARAWHRTYGLPVIISNCSNNYGPFQFPEKLIPLMIIKALKSEALPVYGKGDNVRDWLYVYDHVRALLTVLERGAPGESYNIGGGCELTNLEVVRKLCQCLDQMVPGSGHKPHEGLIAFVQDRPGHDFRYAMDASKIKRELAWAPEENFESGLAQTVSWYLDNRWWWEKIMSRQYSGQRLGLGAKA